MRRQFLALALILPLLTACNDGFSETHWEPLWGAPGGGGESAPAPAPAPAQPNLPGTATTKMLTDPEATESNGSDYVWADNRDAARQMCQRIAERNGWRLDDVDDGEGIALQTGRKRFTCYFTMFGAPRP